MASINLVRYLKNVPGWHINRRIVIFESDDWGSIRMPSQDVFKYLTSKGIFKGNELYNLYENLASREDLSTLFELLHSFKDVNGNLCSFTAVCVVANPDFRKIKEHEFREYFFEPFTVTLEHFYPNDKVFEVWKEGIEERVFVPQFHGREHLNVAEWIRALRNGDEETHLCFEHRVWSFTRKENNPISISYQTPFVFYYPEDLVTQARAIEEGLKVFHELFGYKAKFFVPPDGPFNSSLEKVAADMGIKYISTAKIQKEPTGYGRKKIRVHWLGQKNKYNQIYTTRNCFFEPIVPGKDWVDSCLRDIEAAFYWHKPAIISSHRANYIGTYDRKNRDNTLQQLSLLLNSLIKKWPDTEFMTTDQLGELIEWDRNN